MLAVVGDFNVDFSRTDRRHTKDLLQFMHTNSLIAKDLDFPDVQLTFSSDDGLWRSWVDHVLISLTCVQRIQEITVISSGMNLSDHRPLCIKLDCAYTCTQSGHQLSPSQLSSHNVAWHKATPTQILDYQSLVDKFCHRTLIPTDVISCTNPACSEHCNLLDHLCVEVIDSLIQCADCAIPKLGGKHLAGWSEEVKPIREKSLL